MSVVIALKDEKGACWLACDKQITNGTRKSYLPETRNKVFDVKDRPGCMIGHVGYLRGINLLETNNIYFDELSWYRKELDYQYMVNSFVPTVNAMFHNAGFIDDDVTVVDLKGETLAIVNNLIFEVGSDGSVMEIDKYSAVGSGSEFALGSLDTTEGSDPKERLILALQAANKSIYCGGGGIIINNVDKEIYQIEF